MAKMTAFDKAIFQADGVSQLAVTLGVSRQTIYNWKEKGIPSREALRALAAAGGVSQQSLRPFLKKTS